MVLSVMNLLYRVVLFITNGSPGAKNIFSMTTSATHRYTRKQKRVYLIYHLQVLTQENKTTTTRDNPGRIKNRFY
jgi:hypothetical protein